MHQRSNEESIRFRVRPATAADAAEIAIHRSSMFVDMGTINADAAPALQAMTRDYLAHAMPAREYVAWMVYDESTPDVIAGGCGLLLRQIPPFPIMTGPRAGELASGKQGLVMNVYVHRAWRRRGLADMLMREVLAFAESEGVESLVLHASAEGRPLYEKLGFAATNEMRLVPV